MGLDKNIRAHAFPERAGICMRCGMTWAKFMDKGQRVFTGKK